MFGEGNPEAKLVFIGEGPGFHEDNTGRPFVGPAGQLLDKMITAMGLTRKDVFITNIVKCRPPDNRAPTETEATSCIGHVHQEMWAIKPRVIVCLGMTAAKWVMASGHGWPSKPTMKAIHGHWQQNTYLGSTAKPVYITATYHPAALLRNEDLKVPTWEDLQKVMKVLEELNEQEA